MNWDFLTPSQSTNIYTRALEIDSNMKNCYPPASNMTCQDIDHQGGHFQKGHALTIPYSWPTSSNRHTSLSPATGWDSSLVPTMPCLAPRPSDISSSLRKAKRCFACWFGVQSFHGITVSDLRANALKRVGFKANPS